MAKKAAGETFGQLLAVAAQELGLTYTGLAARLAISPKTVARWTARGRALPPQAQRYAIVYALRDVSRPLLVSMAAALGIDPQAIPLPETTATASRAMAKDALEAALLATAEKLQGVPAGLVRDAVVPLIGRIADLGLDARTAAQILARR